MSTAVTDVARAPARRPSKRKMGLWMATALVIGNIASNRFESSPQVGGVARRAVAVASERDQSRKRHHRKRNQRNQHDDRDDHPRVIHGGRV